ncbi:MAG TPA: hypothetical protein VHD56_01275 [Tepidisphaeraceae bacterium]|nr:hypothetical protein [Tepidisphaeraceae bacterium]
MATTKFRVPSYCVHTARNQAYVRLDGEMIYLGVPDSPQSKEKYDRLIAEWMQAGRVYVNPADKGGLSVNEVLLGLPTAVTLNSSTSIWTEPRQQKLTA